MTLTETIRLQIHKKHIGQAIVIAIIWLLQIILRQTLQGAISWTSNNSIKTYRPTSEVQNTLRSRRCPWNYVMHSQGHSMQVCHYLHLLNPSRTVNRLSKSTCLQLFNSLASQVPVGLPAQRATMFYAGDPRNGLHGWSTRVIRNTITLREWLSQVLSWKEVVSYRQLSSVIQKRADESFPNRIKILLKATLAIETSNLGAFKLKPNVCACHGLGLVAIVPLLNPPAPYIQSVTDIPWLNHRCPV